MNIRKPYHGRPKDTRRAQRGGFSTGPRRTGANERPNDGTHQTSGAAVPRLTPQSSASALTPRMNSNPTPRPMLHSQPQNNMQREERSIERAAGGFSRSQGSRNDRNDQRGDSQDRQQDRPQERRSGGNRGGGGGRRMMRRPEPPQKRLVGNVSRPMETGHIPPLAPGNIRIIPLGGVEKIGTNMTAIEIGNDIIVMDAGFGFSDEGTPGIDYILPNTKYLEERKDRVRAIIVTHGHLDHIGGIPYIMDRIGNPPMYTRNLTALMIKKRQAEFPHLEPIDFKIVETNDRIKIGDTVVQFFGVTHSIPDSVGIAVETPYGYVVNPGDFKLDHVDEVPTKEEEELYSFFENKQVLMFLGESTNIENPGFSTPERLVHENLDVVVRDIKGRLIVGMFASHFHRIAKIIESSEKYGKKVVIEGRSMKNNVDVAIQAGILNVKKGTIIPPQDINNYPPNKIVVLATGAQGDEFAALMRMSNGTYKHFKLNDRDTVLLSASIVPGNERAVDKLKDNLARMGVNIVHYRTSELFIHSTGHANRGEIEWLHRKLKPRFFIPIHGTFYKLKLHSELAMQLGMPKDHIVIPDNGTIVEIRDNGEKLVRLAEKAPDNTVIVDGFTIGDIQDVVIRDRQVLSQDGIFVVIALINASTGKLKKSPDIISRGSVYLRESQDLLRETRYLVKHVVEQATENMHPINIDYVKDVVSESLSKFIFQHTAKRPIVIPVMICI